MLSFTKWLEHLHIDASPDFATEKQRRILGLSKTTNCLKSKLEAIGIHVKFKLVSGQERASNKRGLRGFDLQADPNVITIVRDDSLADPLTCWMMLHQIGHAMERSMQASNQYRMVYGMIMHWWKQYHPYIMKEAIDFTNFKLPDPDDPIYDILPPLKPLAKQPAPVPEVPKRKVIPPVNFADPAHRKAMGQQIKAGGEHYNVGASHAMAHAVFSKFLAMKSARDTWEGFRQSFHQGYTAWGSVTHYSGGRAQFSAQDELINELVAEYVWHGKIRYVNDPQDPYVQAHPEAMPQMMVKIGELIREGLEIMKGTVIALD